MAVIHRSKIEIAVDLDENKIPEKILWQAEDSDRQSPQQTKAIMLSFWNNQSKETLRIDLWTKDMPVDEMKHFFHQTLLSMSDTFQRATSDEKMSETMKDFCDYFAEKMGIKK